MKGLKVWHGANKDNCAFKLFLETERKEAEQHLKVMMKGTKLHSGIEEIEVNRCECGQLAFADMTECLCCEKLKMNWVTENYLLNDGC